MKNKTDGAVSGSQAELINRVQAALDGDLEKLKSSSVTIENVNQLFTINDVNATLLYLAAQNGHTEMVRWLSGIGADVNTTGINGMTPLHTAILHHHPETAAVLLEYTTDINYRNSTGATAISMACSHGTLAMVKALITKGANPNIPGDNGFFPIHCAALRGESEILELLLANGCHVEQSTGAKAGCFATPLYLAAEKGHTAVVHWLSGIGAK